MPGNSVGSVYLDLETNSAQFQSEINNIANDVTGRVTSVFAKFGKVVGGAFAVSKLIQFGKASIDLASDLAEVQNVVDVVFGESANHVNNFAKSALQSYGLSELSAKQYTSTMGAMLKSMGLTQDKVLGMSESITALTGDMASFYNLDTDAAFQKIRAGISGETEPLKQLGINMSVANMQAYALSQGITTSYQKMSQSEQALLRYNYLLSVTADAQGDFARTSDSWANQVRILGENFNTLKGILGSAFITALTPVVRWLNVVIGKLQIVAAYFKAFVEALTGVKAESNSLSVSTGDVSGGLGGVSDAANKAAKSTDKAAKAAKAAKNALAGFDKLNVLPSQNADSGGSGSGGGSGGAGGVSGDLGLGSLADAKLPDLTPEIDTSKVEKFANFCKKIKDYIPVIGAGLAGWKLGKFITDLVTANTKAEGLKESLRLLGKKISITAGVTMVVSGIALEAKGIKEAIQKELNKVNFAEILGGGGLIISGAALLGKSFGKTLLGTGIGAVVAGIPMYITGVFDACRNGLNLLNGLLIPAGSTIAGAGIGAIIGSLGGPIGTGIGALAGLIIGAVTDLVILIVQNWDSIVSFFQSSCEKISKFFSDLWAGIKSVWNSVSGWFKTTIIQPITTFFSNMWKSISDKAKAAWDAIVKFFSPAISWFSKLFNSVKKTISDIFYDIGVIVKGCWEIIKAVWAVVADWFNQHVIQPVSKFFTTLWDGIKTAATKAWDGIKSVFGTISGWINTNIIQPVGKFFGDLWSGFSNKAKDAWEATKKVFSKVGQFFGDTFRDAWAKVVKVFSVAGEIFTNIKDGILKAFKKVVNGIISGINRVVSIPFNGINTALNKIKNIKILGIQPFTGLKTISVPTIPYLARGGIIDQPTLAMVGERGKEAVVPLENTAFADSIANALLRVLTPLFKNNNNMSNSNNGDSVIVLKVGEYELGRIAVKSINKYHTTIGKVELEVI